MDAPNVQDQQTRAPPLHRVRRSRVRRTGRHPDRVPPRVGPDGAGARHARRQARRAHRHAGARGRHARVDDQGAQAVAVGEVRELYVGHDRARGEERRDRERG